MRRNEERSKFDEMRRGGNYLLSKYEEGYGEMGEILNHGSVSPTCTLFSSLLSLLDSLPLLSSQSTYVRSRRLPSRREKRTPLPPQSGNPHSTV